MLLRSLPSAVDYLFFFVYMTVSCVHKILVDQSSIILIMIWRFQRLFNTGHDAKLLNKRSF